MKLVVTAFVTLDGIVEAPGFDEHRTGCNGVPGEWELFEARTSDR